MKLRAFICFLLPSAAARVDPLPANAPGPALDQAVACVITANLELQSRPGMPAVGPKLSSPAMTGTADCSLPSSKMRTMHRRTGAPGGVRFAYPGVFLAVFLSLAPGSRSIAQEAPIKAEADMPAAAPAVVTSLNALLEEAGRNNPSIRAAMLGWQAASEVPSQVSTLPDPQVQLQQMNVGSPRPFAGYTSNNFAYVGLGVSQDIPFPGKLRLRGEIAKAGAEVSERQYESIRLAVLAELKAVYFHLAYLSKTLGILESDGALLRQMTDAAGARYRSGMGNQQDVIQAQLEQTKLIQEITTRHLEVDQQEAQIKQLLNRPQSSPDIEPAGIAETPLPQTYESLLAAAEAKNPGIGGAKKMVDLQSLQVDLARKDFYPDFTAQYMVQRTDPSKYDAYYMATFGIRVPIFERRKQRHALAQARAELDQSRSDYEAQSAQVASELRTEYVTANRTAELLKNYREGLDPQARAEFQAGLAGYESGKEDFQGLLTAFLDVLHLDEGYWQDMATYETSVARLEQITGLSLRDKGANR